MNRDDYLSFLEDLKQNVIDGLLNNPINKVVIGLSGGLDSALVTYFAVKAYGNKNVSTIFMPSENTSNLSGKIVEKISNNLGVDMLISYIDDLTCGYLSRNEKNRRRELIFYKNITFENIQSRIRANILMMFSNEYGHYVLNTGNKTEGSMNYFTTYGDSIGVLAPIGNLYKTIIYDLCNFINDDEKEEIFPKELLEREPTAELSNGQIDKDEMGDYKIIDKILMFNELLYSRQLSGADLLMLCSKLINFGITNEEIERIYTISENTTFPNKKDVLPPAIDVNIPNEVLSYLIEREI